jgi:type I restriction enzyme S subunit
VGDLIQKKFGALGDLFDGPHATPTRRSDGPYFLNISSLSSGRLDLSKSDHVSEADFEKWTRRVTPRVGDLLFSYETRIGEAALMPEGVRACLGRRMALLRPDRSQVDPRFLLYYYLSPDFQRTIARHTIHGATVTRIGLATMPDWDVEIPELPTQQAIADILGALDDKIAANTRLQTTADDLAGAAWSRSAPGGDPIPLSKLASFVNGKAFTKGASGHGRVVVRIAELNSGLGGSTIYNDIEVPDEHLARPGDLLFAWSGSLTVARWFRSEAIVNQHIFKVIPNHGYPAWLVNQALRAKLDDFKAIASDKATTMGHIRRRHLGEVTKVPAEAEVRCLDPIMSALWLQALASEQENLLLARTRDELLPLLMSGKARVKDAEVAVSDVV